MPQQSDNKFPEILFRGLSDKEKDEFKRLLIHSDLIRRLVNVIKSFREEEESVPVADYNSPSWSHRQADRNGSVRAYNRILKLLDHKE